MKSTTTDTDEFRRRWNSHIEQIARLGWSLEGDDVTRLLEIQDELKSLVETAADDFEGEN